MNFRAVSTENEMKIVRICIMQWLVESGQEELVGGTAYMSVLRKPCLIGGCQFFGFLEGIGAWKSLYSV